MSSEQPRARGSWFFQLAPALVALIGVLVGAAVTSGVTYLVDHNRGKADERGAERLVLTEVVSDDAVLKRWAVLRRPAVLKRPGELTDAAWRAERERLARSLSDAEWAWVAKYYRDLAETRDGASGGMKRLKHDEPCTLVALNAGSYSHSQEVEASGNESKCRNPPSTP